MDNNISYLNINRNRYFDNNKYEYIYQKYAYVPEYNIKDNSYTNIIYSYNNNVNDIYSYCADIYSYIYNEDNKIKTSYEFNSSYITTYINEYLSKSADNITVLFPYSTKGNYENEYAYESYKIMTKEF